MNGEFVCVGFLMSLCKSLKDAFLCVDTDPCDGFGPISVLALPRSIADNKKSLVMFFESKAVAASQPAVSINP